MEKVLNSFVSPASRSKGTDHSADLVEVYELQDQVENGPSGDPSDFVVHKVPVLVESYHLSKVLQERAKGADLKSIIARCERTGDFSVLQQKEAVYGDAYAQPVSLSDALEEGVKTSQFIDSLSAEERERYIKLAKMNESEFADYISKLYEQKKAASEALKSEEKGQE